MTSSSGDGVPVELRISVFDGPARGREFVIPARERIYVGRGLHSNVTLLEDTTIGKIHFSIGWCHGALALEDNDGPGGTWHNGMRVSQAVLRNRDVLRAGRSGMEVELLGADPSRARACDLCGRPVSDQTRDADPEGCADGGYVCSPCREDASAPADGPAPVARIAPPREIAGWAIRELIQETPHSEVYRALGSAGDAVAVKLMRLDPGADRATVMRQALRQFREARALMRLHHPHVLTLHRYGSWRGLPYVVLEFVPGGDLGALLRRRSGPLDLPHAARFAVQMLAALDHCHARKVVNRDVKPDNLLLTVPDESGSIKLADMGIAKCIEGSQFEGMTASGEYGGTLEYMAPEQAKQFRDARPAMDVYAAAATIQRMLTGRSIYPPASHPLEQLKLVCAGKHIPLASLRPDLPPEVCVAVEAGLHLDPARRPSARALGEQLRPFALAPALAPEAEFAPERVG